MERFFIKLFVAVLTFSLLSAVPDMREPFDKTAYRGTLWSQVNPWFPANKPRDFPSLGGPNYARKVYPGYNDSYNVESWKEMILECQKYGMTGWQFELNAPAPGFSDQFKAVLRAAEELKTDFKLCAFVGVFRGDHSFQEAKELLLNQFRMFKNEWKNHPNIYRLDGRPVISIYTPFDFSPEEWKTVMDEFEGEFGKTIWLFNFWFKTYDVKSKPEQIRAYMPYFDGITAYANWSLDTQTELYQTIAEIMHREFPQKIFEGSVHNTYSVHFFHGGPATKLSEKYRKSWDSMADAKVDSIVMTNLFDHWENSLVLPCYERGDFILRYAQYQRNRIFGTPFPKSKTPELVLTSYIDVIPGTRPLDFEVISFPIETERKEMNIGLDLCDTSGKVLHSFPAEKISLDELSVLKFTAPVEKFYRERAVVPRIRGTRIGRPYLGAFQPPTILDPSIRTSMMFWAESTVSSVKADSGKWSLNGVGPGGTVNWNESNGIGFFRADIRPVSGKIEFVRIMRNGRELYKLMRKDLAFGQAFPLPNPGESLNYYWLEMENASGERFRSLPVWVTADRRPGTVPFRFPGSAESVEIEKARIPVFEYPCNIDTGELLLDVSGYTHHGRLQRDGVVGYAYGSLEHTDYYHVHDGAVSAAENPLFKRDSDGRGYLDFRASEKNFYMISGESAMPYSSTYALEFRPEPNGEEMYLLGSANNQINVNLDKEGFLHAVRGSAAEGEGGIAPKAVFSVDVKSLAPVEAGKWHSLKVVYNGRELSLYLDGKLQGKTPCAPTSAHETIDHLTLASYCGFLHTTGSYFNGGIRNLRISGFAEE